MIIGEGVTNVGSYAFYQHATLTEVELGDSVKKIGNGAFYECKVKLTKVTLPSGLQTIDINAFNGVTFDTIELPDGLTKIGRKRAAADGLQCTGKLDLRQRTVAGKRTGTDAGHRVRYGHVFRLQVPESTAMTPRPRR